MSMRLSGLGIMGAVAFLLGTLLIGVPAGAQAPVPADVVACDVLVGEQGVRVEIGAEGEFTHRSFRVDDPARFVVDLVGAVVKAGPERVAGDGLLVRSVRTSQYAVDPQPVTRIVVELVSDTAVRVERTGDGLALVIGGATSVGEARLTAAQAQPAQDLAANPPQVVFQRADTLPGHRAEPAGADNWQTGSSLGQIAEPQRRDTDGSYARTMNLNMQNADIRTILRAIADFSGRNIIASPEVKGTVTVALTDVPWREALSVILRANAFGFVEEDGIIRVDTAERLRTEELAEKAAAQRSKELEPLVTRIVPIDYANATEVKSSVQKMLSQRGSVEVDPRTNSLIVTDVPAMVGELQRLARELDTRTPQVHIDALMVDIDSNQGRELGIKWGALNAAPSKLSLAGDAVVDRQITESAGTLRVGTVLNWTELQLELQSLERRNLANIISNPRITTTDNREASILVGQKIPLITQDVAGNPVTRLETIGIRLTVTPHINSDKQITLDVHPEVSDLSSQATVQGGVIINTSEADTRVLVNNRETAVIGGLIRNVSNDFEAGVPVLKDLPFLGALFRTKSTTTSQRELVVFLTPTIVGEDGTAPDTYESGLREDVQDLLQRNRAGVMR